MIEHRPNSPTRQPPGGHLSYGKSERPSVRRTVQMSEVLNIARGRHVTGRV